jgi:hypothetical protein
MTIAQTGQTSKTNVGDNSGMGYCGGVASQVMTIDDASQYTISVAASTGSCASRLGPLLIGTQTYDINKTDQTSNGDCMTTDPQAVNISTMSVNTSGVGSKTLNGSTVNANTKALCVSSSNGGNGNQMSVNVI